MNAASLETGRPVATEQSPYAFMQALCNSCRFMSLLTTDQSNVLRFHQNRDMFNQATAALLVDALCHRESGFGPVQHQARQTNRLTSARCASGRKVAAPAKLMPSMKSAAV